MQVYYKTPKTSETGKAFQKLEDKKAAIFELTDAFRKKIGAENCFYSQSFHYIGKINIFSGFEKPADPLIWKVDKRVPNGFSLRRNKFAKHLQAEIDLIPIITNAELNQCVGLNIDIWQSIGYNSRQKDVFKFTIHSEWGKPNADCVEILGSEYQLED